MYELYDEKERRRAQSDQLCQSPSLHSSSSQSHIGLVFFFIQRSEDAFWSFWLKKDPFFWGVFGTLTNDSLSFLCF